MSYLPDLPVFLAYLLAVIALTLTPGPDMALFLGKAIGQSRVAGLAAFAGASTGLVVHTFAVAVGLSALLAASATAFTILKIAGAGYLVYLAIQALRHGSALSLGSTGAEPLRSAYLKGLWINLLNPKIIVFFVTFLPQFVSPSDPHAASKLIFLGFTFVLAATPICVMLIVFAAGMARFVKTSPRATRLVDWLFATVMGGFAVKLILAQGR